ncbi:bifunctional metallophosphatase/5'-nucleotidase [bacterium]|nr:bifunctional metallophosphatase/5'-nucleotidase [bacterium]MBU1983519.1 bifunctional metallophosphatase/5'-nucleotidase [bacterium]
MKKLLLLIAALCLLSSGASAADTWSLVVLYSNDVHGGIDSSKAVFMNPEMPPDLGGGASAARMIRQMREYAKRTGKGFLLLDTGDIFQGTLVGTKSRGEAVMRYMNQVGYDAWVIGNHEFDLGRDVCEAVMKQAEFPTLSANIYDSTAAGGLDHFAQPYVLKDFGSIKIGVVGITTSGTMRASFEDNVRGLYFAPETISLAAYRDSVRARGADVVIAACHLGLPYDRWDAWDDLEKREQEGWKSDYVRNAFELARRVPGIDILFAGDIHVGYQKPWVDPVNHTPCFQGYGRGTNLLAVEFEFDLKTKKLLGWKPFTDDGTLVTLFTERFPRDRGVAETIDTVVARVEEGFSEKIGEATAPILRSGEGETPLGNLVTDAMRWKLHGDVAITNKGGIRTDLPAGIITPRDVFNVLPFDNTLGAVNVTGAFLKELLEDKVAYGGSGLDVSGVTVRVDRSKPRGERIVTLDVGGKPYDPTARYRLVTTDYLLEGNSGMEKLAALRNEAAVESGSYMRDAVIEYIQQHSPLEPKLDGRWITVGGNP